MLAKRWVSATFKSGYIEHVFKVGCQCGFEVVWQVFLIDSLVDIFEVEVCSVSCGCVCEIKDADNGEVISLSWPESRVDIT
jgi:hypothetical protein